MMMRKNAVQLMIFYFIGLVFFSHVDGYVYNDEYGMVDNTLCETLHVLSKFSDVMKGYLSLLPKNEAQFEHHIALLDTIILREGTQNKLTSMHAQRLIESFLRQITHYRLRETSLSLQNMLIEMEMICNNTLKIIKADFLFQKKSRNKRWLDGNFYTMIVLSGIGLVSIIAYYAYSRGLLNENFNIEQLENKLEEEKKLLEELARTKKVFTDSLDSLPVYKDVSMLDTTITMSNRYEKEIRALKEHYNLQKNNAQYSALLEEFTTEIATLEKFKKLKTETETIVKEALKQGEEICTTLNREVQSREQVFTSPKRPLRGALGTPLGVRPVGKSSRRRLIQSKSFSVRGEV